MFSDDFSISLLQEGVGVLGTQARRTLIQIVSETGITTAIYEPYNDFLTQVTQYFQAALPPILETESQRRASVGKSPTNQRRFSFGKSVDPKEIESRQIANFFSAYLLIEQFLLRDATYNPLVRDLQSEMLPFFVKLLNAMSRYYSTINVWLMDFSNTIIKSGRTFSFGRARASSVSAQPAFFPWNDTARQFLDSDTMRAFNAEVLSEKRGTLPLSIYQPGVTQDAIKQSVTNLIKIGIVNSPEYFTQLYQKVISLLEVFSPALFTTDIGKQTANSHVIFYLELIKFYWVLQKEVIGDLGTPELKQAYSEIIFNRRIIMAAGKFTINSALSSSVLAVPQAPGLSKALTPVSGADRCYLCNDVVFFRRYLYNSQGFYDSLADSRSQLAPANEIYHESSQCGECKKPFCNDCKKTKVLNCQRCKAIICRYCYDKHSCSVQIDSRYDSRLFPLSPPFFITDRLTLTCSRCSITYTQGIPGSGCKICSIYLCPDCGSPHPHANPNWSKGLKIDRGSESD